MKSSICRLDDVQCHGRRYCRQIALHFAQWANAGLAVDIEEAISLLVSGQVTTEDSVGLAVAMKAAADEGRKESNQLSLHESNSDLEIECGPSL